MFKLFNKINHKLYLYTIATTSLTVTYLFYNNIKLEEYKKILNLNLIFN